MSVELQSRRVNVMEYAGKDHLLSVVRGARAGFYELIDAADDEVWQTPTACTEWEVRDVVAHMVDVTEAYLQRWSLARGGGEIPVALGVQEVMPRGLDSSAKRLRSVPRRELIDRLKGASDQLFTIFDGLTAEQWSGEIVHHVYMGPVPAFIYIGFQLIDYTVHGWDIRAGLGLTTPLPSDQAGALVPFMLHVLLPSTIDPAASAGFVATWGVRVSGDQGGSWRLSLDGGKLSASEDSVSGLPVVFNFDPSDFVLTCFQRVAGGAAIGDQDLAARIRRLWYKI